LSRLTFRLLKQALDEKIIERYERNQATFYRAPAWPRPQSHLIRFRSFPDKKLQKEVKSEYIVRSFDEFL